MLGQSVQTLQTVAVPEIQQHQQQQIVFQQAPASNFKTCNGNFLTLRIVLLFRFGYYETRRYGRTSNEPR